MREPPLNLSDETLRASLATHYRLAITEFDFLPLGHDSSAWVYRARTNAGTYFVKVRLSVTNEASLLVPRYLHDRGVAHVVAPLPTTAGKLWAEAGGYAHILYPFVAGATGMERGLSDAQWSDYGALLRQVHDVEVAPEVERVMAREWFIPAWADTVRQLDAHIDGHPFEDSAAQELASFWQARREQIRTVLDRADDLGQRLAQTAPPVVLCHADIHTANVLVADDGQVWIVDWDETVLAPRERDLMFVVGGIHSRLVGPREEALFFQGYGSTSVDPLALAYYRYAWAVGDIGAFGEEVFFRPDLGTVTKRAAVEAFLSLFRPGAIVALAFASGDGTASSR